MHNRVIEDIKEENSLTPKIIVIGVGGAGGNAVNNMIRSNLEGVSFIAANTDAQALQQSLAPHNQRVQLGLNKTKGLGAGSKPEIGAEAAEESLDEIVKFIKGANMVFITAGMGGGTGTGAAPVIARIAREAGILTVGVVTKPFSFEGAHRSRSAEGGINELQQYVDTLLVIPNQNLFRLANENTTFADAFQMADNVLYSGVRGVTDLMIMPGLINLDFADIRAIMSEMGKAMMGTGEAEGDRRALDAAEAAISNPLLDDVSLQGASGILINITGGYDMTLYEVDEAANRIREEVESDANIIFGSTFDERMNGKIRVSVVATGIGSKHNAYTKRPDMPSSMADLAPKKSVTDKNAPKSILEGFQDTPYKSELDEGSVDKDMQQEIAKPASQPKGGRYAENTEPPKRRSIFDRISSRGFSRNSDEKSNVGAQSQADQSYERYADPEIEKETNDIPPCFRKK